jgi:hypothetical protein
LTPRRVRFTATAQGSLKREQASWHENRIRIEVFATEVEAALRFLAQLPGAGTLYDQAGVSGVRRLYVPKVACHLCYTFDEHEVVIRALWGARRRRGPLITR